MDTIKKSVIAVLFVFTALIASVFASPIDVSDVNINTVNGEYMILVTLDNTNVASGIYDELSFTIEELGVSESLGVVTIDSSSEVLTYNLKELTDSYDLLKKGNTYRLTASTSTSSMTESFLFGNEQSTDGLGLILDNVKLNGQEVNDDLLQLMNGEAIEVEMRFSALENFDDARLRITIDGYEHDDLTASTEIFSVKEGTTYVKKLSLQLPSDMDSQKEYKLRISGANDLSGITYKDYNVYVDTSRHRVDVLDLVMTPSSGVEAGQNIIANVRLKNRGQQSQDSVKVIVEIPEYNIEESSYVSNLNAGEVVTSDDMLLFIPEVATAGAHNVVVTLSYDDGYTTSSETYTLNVLAPKMVEEQNLLVSFKNNIDMVAGTQTSFEVVVANPNSESKPISIAPVENAWADVEVTPSLAMVKGGDSVVFTVKVTPKDAVEGEKELTLAVKEGSNTISEITVNSYVEGKQQINWVNVALAVLLVIAIIILLSLVVTIAKRRKEGGDEEVSTEEYY